MRGLRAAVLLATAAATSICGGCAEFQFFWIHRNEPFTEDRTTNLMRDRAALQSCLDVLGAPHRVWESPQGIVLTYGWLDKFYWKFEVVLHGTDLDIDGRTLFSYNSTNNGFEGAVLVFDADLRLKIVRFGRLSDITRDLPKRPTLIEGV